MLDHIYMILGDICLFRYVGQYYAVIWLSMNCFSVDESQTMETPKIFSPTRCFVPADTIVPQKEQKKNIERNTLTRIIVH